MLHFNLLKIRTIQKFIEISNKLINLFLHLLLYYQSNYIDKTSTQIMRFKQKIFIISIIIIKTFKIRGKIMLWTSQCLLKLIYIFVG